MLRLRQNLPELLNFPIVRGEERAQKKLTRHWEEAVVASMSSHPREGGDGERAGARARDVACAIHAAFSLNPEKYEDRAWLWFPAMFLRKQFIPAKGKAGA